MKNVVLIVSLTVLISGCNAKNNQESEQQKEAQTSIATTEQEQSEKQTNDTEGMSFNFEDAQIGQLPEGWTSHFSGEGELPLWQVVDDNGNKVLAQLSENNPSNHFNVVVYDNFSAKDVTLKTRFKGIKGKIDQGGGFVWRFQDADNYYVVRANPLENNVVLYKVEDGKRTDLPLIGKGRTYGTDTPVPSNQWHDIRLEAKGELFTVYVNGEELFQVEDETFNEAGKVGFWTKADAVTYFDDFEVQ